MIDGHIREYCIENGILVDATIELTSRCNLRCRHCYIPERHHELEKELAFDLLGQLQQEGVLNLTLTGGEPLLHPDFLDIYQHAKKLGFLIEVKSNALLVNQPIIDLFRAYPPDELNVTVYGLSNEDYENFCHDPSGFERLTHALDLLHDEAIPFSLHVIANRSNQHDILKGRYRDFFSRYDCDFAFDYDVLNGVDGSEEPLLQRLEPQEIIRLENSDTYYFEEIEAHYARKDGGTTTPFACFAGLSKIFIGADGCAQSCLYDIGHRYDLREQTIPQIRHHLLERHAAINRMYEASPCCSCPKEFLCRTCPLKEKRMEPLFRLDEKCRLASLRAQLVEESKVSYSAQIATGSMQRYRTVDLSFEVLHCGINLDYRASGGDFFSEIANPKVEFVVNGHRVTGSKGKTIFYLPLTQEALARDLGVPPGRALKIVRDDRYYDLPDLEDRLKTYLAISTYLSHSGLGAACFGIWIVRNRSAFKAFNNTRLTIYPENSVFWALEVEHLESVPFGQQENVFNGRGWSNADIAEVISSTMKEIGVQCKDLWVGNLINTSSGLRLVDFFDWYFIAPHPLPSQDQYK